MTTTVQLMKWCTDHGYQLPSITSQWSLPKMNFTTDLEWVGIAILIIFAYEVGKRGLQTVYADIRNWFNAKATTTTTTTTPTTS